MSKRGKYTPEEIAEFKAADEALYDESETVLDDCDALSDIIARTLATGSPRFLSYSLRNLTLIFAQAAARGIEITDIDTKTGWRERGRRPDQFGLRILAPRRDKKSQAASTEGSNQAAEAGTTAASEKPRRRFLMVSVFDISQTVPIEDSTQTPTPAPAQNPSALLWENLTGQAERIGYTVVCLPEPDTHGVDADTTTITVGQGHPVEQLARLLGPLLAAHSRESKTGDPQQGDPDRGIALDLKAFGTAYATTEDDWETARTFYTVSGPRVQGTFSVWIEAAAESATPYRLNVDYGHDDGRRVHVNENDHEQLPKVNGITIVGGTHCIPVAKIDGLDQGDVTCRRPIDRTRSCSAPAATNARLAAVVRALLLQYLARPDLEQLHRAAIAHQAPRARTAELAQAAKLDERIAALMAERDQHTASANRYEFLTDQASTAPTPN